MKKVVNNADDLEQAIAELELKAAAQKRDIQETFKAVSESLKPVNIVKSGFRSLFSGNHQEEIFNAILGLASGFLGRKLLLGKSHGLVSKAVQWGLAGLVSKNADRIKEKAGELIDRFFKKSKPASNHTPETRHAPAFPPDPQQIHA